ncbi:hypothetical protein FPOAC1_003645 [Fusarium poae]|uniref:hypothetical protein n=1 Tax=Fusarium poae TaxID=36050 RepID=UPI001CEBBB97|nr:hypothetical protein FPOAC1_003645 [Fusarium poae]KAG8677621.1 hypothetical protein FPOAC1_003645 [Fusarium poae]
MSTAPNTKLDLRIETKLEHIERMTTTSPQRYQHSFTIKCGFLIFRSAGDYDHERCFSIYDSHLLPNLTGFIETKKQFTPPENAKLLPSELW